jgi:hypothetical protein
MTLSKSPERGTFQINTLVEQVELGERTSEDAEEMMEFYKTHQELVREREATDEWKVDNLEYDLRSNKWICDKVKASEAYAQNLYAAMCNNEFQRNETWPVLSDKRWSCSWRYAGGIVADMREQGDYIDWYCSGIRGEVSEEELKDLTIEQQAHRKKLEAYAGEGFVTDEIENDLYKLGWLVVKETE